MTLEAFWRRRAEGVALARPNLFKAVRGQLDAYGAEMGVPRGTKTPSGWLSDVMYEGDNSYRNAIASEIRLKLSIKGVMMGEQPLRRICCAMGITYRPGEAFNTTKQRCNAILDAWKRELNRKERQRARKRRRQ